MTRNGRTTPFPNEFSTPPTCSSQTSRGSCGSYFPRNLNAPSRNRTCDLVLRRHALYPLSYGRLRLTSVDALKLDARIVTLPLAETFVISRESQDEAEVAQVELRHDGVSGFGEAAPIARYGESAQSACAWLESLELDADPWALDEIGASLPPGEYAARSALDCALYDLQGKLTGLPVWQLLGLRRAGPPTSWTVWLGDPDAMARRAEAAERRGFRRLKLKLGGRDGLDLDRVRAVRAATAVPLQIDVNEYWSL